MAMTYNITADSSPDYDDWGWDDYWQPQDWIVWHRAMKAKYSLDEANKRFIDAFLKAGSFAASYNWRSTDTEFKKYAKANGFYDSLFSGIGGLIGKVASLGGSVITTASDSGSALVENAGQAATNLSESITNTSKVLKVLIPVVVVLVVAGILWYGIKKFKLSKE